MCIRDSFRGAALAVEGHEDEAEGEDGRQEGRDDADRPHYVGAADEGAAEDLVLGPEAGDEGDRADEHRPEGQGYAFSQPAHVAHVLLAAHGVDHRARAQEEEALEAVSYTHLTLPTL